MDIFKPQVVFFDWDDTIFNNIKICNLTIDRLVEKYEDDIKPDVKHPEMKIQDSVKHHFHKHTGIPLPAVIELIFKHNKDYFIKTFREHYLDIKTNHAELLPLAKETVHLLKENNIPQALISNKRGEMIRNEVKSEGLFDYFFDIVGEGDCERHKPYTDQIMKAVEGYDDKIDLSRCWFIGDSSIDMECAFNAKCLPFYIGDMDRLRDEYKKEIGSNIVRIENHNDLQNLILNLD